MRRASCLPLLLVFACGHTVPIDAGETPDGTMTSADGGSSTGTPDASVAAPTPHGRCDPASSFGAFAPFALPALALPLGTFRLSSTSGGAGVLSLGDGDGNGDPHELRSFHFVGDQITSVTSVGSGYDQDAFLGQASLSEDGRTLVVTQTKDRNDSDLFFAHRDEVDQPFPAPKPMIHAGLTDPLFAPYLAGKRIYFSHVPKHANETVMEGDFDPLTGTITSSADVLPAGLAPVFVGTRWIPVVTQDELEIFFGHSVGDNDAEVLHATRASANEAFGTPTSVAAPSGSVGFDYPTWISDDACTLWVVSDRNDNPTVLLRATRP